MQPGQKIRLRGFGVAASGKREAGDLYAIIEVAVPKSLSVEQRDLLKKLKDVGL